MQLNTHLSFRLTYDDESDSGEIILDEVAPGNVAKSSQDPHVGAGPIVLDFDKNDRLLRIEINEFSKIMPIRIMEQIMRNHSS